MNKEDKRITYEEFMTMFKFAPRMCYTLYEKAEDEIEKITKEKDHYRHLYSEIKKRKDDVVEYIKSLRIFSARNNGKTLFVKILNEILRMLGEIDVED